MGSPETRYVKSGALHIAYQVVGEGPCDLIYVPSAFGHVEILWESPAVERFLLGLASFSRLVIFDKRGTGMSDRPGGAPTLTERADDIRAVDGYGGLVAGGLVRNVRRWGDRCQVAAVDPERVSHLIAMGSGPGTYVAPESAEQVIADVVRHWATTRSSRMVRRASRTYPRSALGRLACSNTRCHRGRWPTGSG